MVSKSTSKNSRTSAKLSDAIKADAEDAPASYSVADLENELVETKLQLAQALSEHADTSKHMNDVIAYLKPKALAYDNLSRVLALTENHNTASLASGYAPEYLTRRADSIIADITTKEGERPVDAIMRRSRERNSPVTDRLGGATLAAQQNTGFSSW